MRIFITLLLIAAFILQYAYSSEIIQLSDDSKPRYIISVTHGDNYLGEIEFESFPEVAPKHCQNLDSLVSIKFYDGTAFHRVIPNFMIQGGDPNSRDKDKSTWGFGDPSQTKVPAEFSTLKHLRGTLSAARTNDPNSATSQFFICVVTASHLDGKYSIYGQVINGMDIADQIVSVPRDSRDNPLQKVEMTIKKVEPSSINEVKFNSGNIRISPNPAFDKIGFVNDDENIFVNFVRITDISGRVYFNNEFPSPTNLENLNIPISNYPSGVFYISILDNKGIEFNFRFVKN